MIVSTPDLYHLSYFYDPKKSYLYICVPADIIEAFNSTSRYLDDLLDIENPYFEQMVGQIYPTELQLNKASSSDTEE